MEKPIKASTITGFILFALAAVFSIALLFVLGDLAGGNPAQTTSLYSFGRMLASVYGVCSVLIPVFLVIAAIQCFTETWTIKRGVLLIGSVLPFFTLDAVEHVLRMLIANDEGTVLSIKIIGTLLTSLLILAAEYLILSLLGDLIENALSGRSDDEAAPEALDKDELALEDADVGAEDAVEEKPIAPEEEDAAPEAAASATPDAEPVAAPATAAVVADATATQTPASESTAPAASSATTASSDWDNPFAHIFDEDPDYVKSATSASTAPAADGDGVVAEAAVAPASEGVAVAPAAAATDSAVAEVATAPASADVAAADTDGAVAETATAPASEGVAVAPTDGAVAETATAPASENVADAPAAADINSAVAETATDPASDDISAANAALADSAADSSFEEPVLSADAFAADASTAAASATEQPLPASERPMPRYNDNVTLPAPQEDEPDELMELETFDPETDSYAGFQASAENIAEIEALDDDIAAFEQQNADEFEENIAAIEEAVQEEAADSADNADFSDDFYDIDLNAEDEDEVALAALQHTQQTQQTPPVADESPAADASDEIAIADQRSTSLTEIFDEMYDDAAREAALEAENDAATIADASEIDAASDATLSDGGADDFAPAEEPVESFNDLESDLLATQDAPLDVVTPEEPMFDEETAIDESELEETVTGEIGERADNLIDDEEGEPIFSDVADEEFANDGSDDLSVTVINEAQNVDPLAPPVVDANGEPYEEEIEDVGDLITPNDSALEAAVTEKPVIGTPLQELRVPAATFTVTAAAAAPAVDASAEAHNDALVSEPPRRKNYAVYAIPTEGVLDSYANSDYQVIDEATRQAGDELKATLGDFKIEAEVTGIRKGPVVTMFELLPAPGVKLSKIVALQDNIALRLAASSVRIVAPIPGKHAVGIEVPNKERAIVSFKEIIEQDLPQFKKMAIPVVLGKDISGGAQMIDLAKTPHLLIAGSTGAGKSVCVNTMILSILYKRSPQQVKLIMIDPKVVELKLYNDIPHLLTPVITEPKKAFQSLQYCLCEMERRYALLDGMGVRDIVSYNNRIVERHIATEKLPYIVVIIDEFADLMATTGKELEQTIARLAAMSRAVGIHLVLATQRPSVDVITGLIKANIPSRIAFMVASKMDSRIIIDQVGAEKLLGKGDMLYASATDPFPVRIQGTLVNDNEVERVVNCVKEYGEPEYIDDEIFVDDDDDGSSGASLFNEGEDPLYDEALEIVLQAGKASASYIQRRLKIGYNRAARLVEEMEERGIVGPANGSKPREVIHVPS